MGWLTGAGFGWRTASGQVTGLAHFGVGWLTGAGFGWTVADVALGWAGLLEPDLVGQWLM